MNQPLERLEAMTPLQKAVLALKQTQARVAALESRAREPIALVGMGCRLPGEVDSPASFWRLLCEGRDAVTRVSPSRWPPAITDVSVGERHIDIGQGGFLEDIAYFDHRFFGMTEKESAGTDPQQRLLLEVTWEALEDAGLIPERLRGKGCGVFLGIAASEYGINLACRSEHAGPWIGPGTALCIAANRISYQFDWRGPSLALDTACSSSLLALHLACRSLRDGECDLAVVGGTNLLLTPFGSQNLAHAGFFSPSGKIRAFDEHADGYVRSDGIVVVVLKRATDVRPGTDRPYALILGTAVNQDGRSNGLTAPNRKGQEDLLRAACQAAGVNPADVDYVETQGTGTPIGDSLEAAALGAVYGEGRPADAPLRIGSVKTNIGHTETASGVTSLIKVALALEHRTLPPSLHFRRPNPAIPFSDLKLQVQTQLNPWPRRERLPLAGISAFGFGGTNVHALLQGVDQGEVDSAADDAEYPSLLLLSARSESALKELALRFQPLLSDPSLSWRDLCYSAAVHRQHHEWRLVLKAEDALSALNRLGGYLNGDLDPRVGVGCCNPDHPPRLAFNLGGNKDTSDSLRSFIASGKVFSDALADIEMKLDQLWRLGASAEVSSLVPANDTRMRLLASYRALTIGWRRLGVRPQWVGGAGVGALAAAVEAGVLDWDRAVQTLASGAEEWTLAAGTKPEVTLVLQGKVWDGRSATCISMTAPDPVPDGDMTALAGYAPRGIFDIDQLQLISAAVKDPAESWKVDKECPLIRLLADFHVLGCSIDWSKIMHGRFTRLPTYPWQRRPFWMEGAVPGDHPPPPQTVGELIAQEAKRTEGVVVTPELGPRPDLYTPYEEPATPLELSIAQAWSEVLGLSPIGRHDPFLEMGGDSLRAMMLLNRLQQAMQQTLVPALMLKAQTVAKQAESLRREYPNEVLRLCPDEPGVEWLEMQPLSEGSVKVDEALVRGIRSLIESRIQAEAATPPPEKNPPVCFVLSPPRSGSTLLRVMLAGHEGLFVPPELDLLTIDTLDQWEKYGEIRNSWRNGLVEAFRNAFGWSLDQARSELGRWISENRRSQEIYGLLQQGIGDRLLVDKTPDYSASLTILRKAEQWFRNARYIHLVRHPCDTILSYQEYKLHLAIERTHPMVAGLLPAQIGELTWLMSHDNILRFLAEVPLERCCRIYFESLVAHPRQEMERVARFLGISFCEEMINPYRNQHMKMLEGADGSGLSQGDQKFQHQHRKIDPSVAGRWKTHAPGLTLGELTRDTALRLGYEDLPAPTTLREVVGDTQESRRATDLLERLDELSDAEVESLLRREIGLAELSDGH